LYDENDKPITGATAESSTVAQLSTDYNKYIPQDLLVNLKTDASNKVFFIEAETLGKQKARTKLIVNVDTSKPDEDAGCRFTLSPFKAETVLQYLTEEQIGAENVKRRAAGNDD
jgi:hypothetical protein